jgi:excisionase family DNA binding protein
MTDILFSPIRLNELETLIQNSVERALKARSSNQVETSNQQEQLLTIQQASDFLCLSVPTLYTKVSHKELPCMKRGKRLYFSRTELMEYIKQGKKKTLAEIESEADQYVIKRKGGQK